MNSVLKGSSYVLVHAPDMLVGGGTTQKTERIVNPGSEYLAKLPEHLRSYNDAVSYLPNQVYIGGKTPGDLAAAGATWYDKPLQSAERFGPRGEIMPQDEFYLLMQACDVFDLVQLDKAFVADVRARLEKHPLVDAELMARIAEGAALPDIEKAVSQDHAEGLLHDGKMVGCIKKAHDIDENLSAHVIYENLVSKASCTLSLLHLIRSTGVDKASIDLVLDCSEEACGDMNQRGGGNMAKAAAEISGYSGATGADIRAFCAAPAHAMIHAAALVASGTYDNVVVAAGGSLAKLGMNGKDHVRKGLPIMEDVLGGFAALISKNDGVSPEILSEYTGRHTVGSGSSPQAVITALVTDPLDKMGLKIADVDKFSAEMQNPDITKPAGAGDVPLANYKMIAALAVKRGELDRAEIDGFTEKRGMVGWAPTQGHIPSGVPYLGFARDDILSERVNRCMIIGKGSLFLGRMTNLFDGVSFIMQKNSAAKPASKETAAAITEPASAPKNVSVGTAKIVLTGPGSEHGENNMIEGASIAAARGNNVIYIGARSGDGIRTVPAENDKEAHSIMETLLESGEADGAVTMHYSFPIGVSTVGRVVTPGLGKTMYIATTTGTSSADRVEGMVLNALYGIITAKACGVRNPSVGILNVDGARQAEIALKKLQKNGYNITFAQSGRSDGGSVMRGNDLLTGTCDVLVTDPLTGNIVVKIMSSFTTGGNYESLGWGYGPGIGRDYGKLILILSRASGAPQVANAIEFASELVRGRYKEAVASEFEAANKAGLQEILGALGAKKASADDSNAVSEPPAEVATAEISGIEITDIEDAVSALWRENIYARSGMGCTGPVIMVNEGKLKQAEKILAAAGFIDFC